ncbi:DUF5689 domain-containing protein [uncultured Winogradskyella sp.]|uniref:DUF5689 domain-containing protein n=1 Tax=uncultured Winogradskyella sp. TaxID=395353 RepID=UPI0026136E61|nr:DUF5689 domain-containing protein [uncultured Winogradskyella sp.]
MKTNKLNKLTILLIGLLVFTACVEDDDYNLPNLSVNEVEFGENDVIIDIDAVLGNFNQNGEPYPFEDHENYDVYTSGYVISSDEGGNFFEELVIQDKAENPTAGVVIQVDVNPLFTLYEFGRKVFIKLDGLTIAEDNGVLQLGTGAGNSIEKISGTKRAEHIILDPEVATIVPLDVTIADFTNDLESQFIRLNDMQFNRNDVLGENPLTFAAEDTDEFDGERSVENCATGASVIMSTSTFSDFKSLPLPANRGFISGVLTRDFFDDFYTIVINSPEDINFDNDERCDPDFFECNEASGGGSAFFSENFESFAGYDAEGWTNVNISGGGTEWITGSFGGSAYAQISGFNSGDDEINVWLVTPEINMDTTDGEELSFDVQANFDNGTILTVYFSNDFTGDPTAATWQLLDATIPVGPSGGFGSFESVGPINISCIDGDVHFGFFYEGSDPSATTRYHVDNIEITGN